ncbi:hypothetical protein J3R82DRAFT_10153 [Butyriboletus roseoflavus]|nr:hypothetical protein J3R82DRAFT_10153 [Butyriboletus roseoflavus]
MYTRSPYVGGGSMQHQHVSAGIPSLPSVLQPPQRSEMRSASVQLHAAPTAGAADTFPGSIDHVSQTGRFPDGAVRQFDCAHPPLRVGPEPRVNAQSLGNVNAPSRETVEASALCFTPGHQTWEEMVETALAPRSHPSLPRQARPWEPSEPTHIQLPSLVNNETSSVEQAHSQNVDDDTSDDVYTFFCEWTDEHGTCNMDILGDRVWMSHHLSRHHNVVGHEKTQRTCLWRGCTDTMNKGSLARHVVSRHLRAGASCGFCSKVYSRADVARRHTKKCKVANGGSAQYEQTKW